MTHWDRVCYTATPPYPAIQMAEVEPQVSLKRPWQYTCTNAFKCEEENRIMTFCPLNIISHCRMLNRIFYPSLYIDQELSELRNSQTYEVSLLKALIKMIGTKFSSTWTASMLFNCIT